MQRTTKALQISVNRAPSLQSDGQSNQQLDEDTCHNISEIWTRNQIYTVVPVNETTYVRIPHVFTSTGEQSIGKNQIDVSPKIFSQLVEEATI